MGFANLTMFPLRVEYLSNTRYGLNLSATDIALLTSIIPNVARLCFSRAWGRLFDRMDFLTLRAILNTGFMLGILSFFTGTGWPGLTAGAILFGISNAGADVAWTLWVTKFAPPGRVTEYMAVHTFLTGLRGIVAPFAAFYLASHAGIGPTAIAMALMILAASLILSRKVNPAVTA
jgi:MFS family permease